MPVINEITIKKSIKSYQSEAGLFVLFLFLLILPVTPYDAYILGETYANHVMSDDMNSKIYGMIMLAAMFSVLVRSYLGYINTECK